MVEAGLQAFAAGMAVRRRREREWMGLPPAPAREEPPEEELPSPSVQPVEMPACDAQRDHAGAFGNHLIHAQAIPEPLNDGQREPKQYEHCQGSQVERGSVGRGAGIGNELIAGGYLMEPGEHDPGVGHEVDQVPRLVAQTTPHND